MQLSSLPDEVCIKIGEFSNPVERRVIEEVLPVCERMMEKELSDSLLSLSSLCICKRAWPKSLYHSRCSICTDAKNGFTVAFNPINDKKISTERIVDNFVYNMAKADHDSCCQSRRRSQRMNKPYKDDYGNFIYQRPICFRPDNPYLYSMLVKAINEEYSEHGIQAFDLNKAVVIPRRNSEADSVVKKVCEKIKIRFMCGMCDQIDRRRIAIGELK